MTFRQHDTCSKFNVGDDVEVVNGNSSFFGCQGAVTSAFQSSGRTVVKVWLPGVLEDGRGAEVAFAEHELRAIPGF